MSFEQVNVNARNLDNQEEPSAAHEYAAAISPVIVKDEPPSASTENYHPLLRTGALLVSVAAVCSSCSRSCP